MLGLLLVLAGAGGCVHRYPVVRHQDPPLTRDEAGRLAAAGVAEPVLIELVEKRGALKLSADDIVEIKKAGASDGVIQKMITLERREPERVRYVEYDTDYYYYHRPYYPWWGPSYYYHHSGGSHHHHGGHRSGFGMHFGW